MKVTTKGQVAIPQEFREELGVHPGTEVEFVLENKELKVIPTSRPKNPGRQLVEHMRGKATIRMTTDEIMALTRGTL